MRQRQITYPILILIAALVLGAFLRFYAIGEVMHFENDEARDFIAVGEMLQSPRADGWLRGPASSFGNFSLGPAFYYFLLIPYGLTNGNPVAGAVAVAAVGVLTIGLLYVIGKKLFTPWAGAVAALLYAVSFLMVRYDRFAWNPNILPAAVLLLVWMVLHLLADGRQVAPQRSRWLWGIGLVAGIIAQLHTVGFLFIPLLILLFIFLRIRVQPWRRVVEGVGFFMLTFVPLLIYDITHHFANTRGMLGALRAVGAGAPVGFADRIGRTYEQITNFVSEATTVYTSRLFVGLFLLTAVNVVIAFVWRQRKNPTAWMMRVGATLILLWIGVFGFAYLLFPGTLFVHYFTPWYPLLFLLLGAGLAGALGELAAWHTTGGRIAAVVTGAVLAWIIFASNLTAFTTYVSDARAGERTTFFSESTTYGQLRAAAAIVRRDTGGSSFSAALLSAEQYGTVVRVLFPEATPADSAARQYIIVVSETTPASQLPPTATFVDQVGALQVYRIEKRTR